MTFEEQEEIVDKQLGRMGNLHHPPGDRAFLIAQGIYDGVFYEY